MLSRHRSRCRYPHGHSRTIEVVVASDALDDQGMVVDFKALKTLVEEHVARYDHAMAIHKDDPLLPELQRLYPESVLVFEQTDPTTEAMALEIFEHVRARLASGFSCDCDGVRYSVPAGSVRLERLRVWETPTSWAEVGA